MGQAIMHQIHTVYVWITCKSIIFRGIACSKDKKMVVFPTEKLKFWAFDLQIWPLYDHCLTLSDYKPICKYEYSYLHEFWMLKCIIHEGILCRSC